MEKKGDFRMTWQGWIFICLAWGFVSIIFFYSFYRILFNDRNQHERKKSVRGKESVDK